MDHWGSGCHGWIRSRPTGGVVRQRWCGGHDWDTPTRSKQWRITPSRWWVALGLSQVECLGFSIGGYVAQTLALRHRTLVRRMILVATGPRGGDPSQDPHAAEYAASTDPITGESSLEAFLYLFFRPTATSQAPGRAFLGASARTEEGTIDQSEYANVATRSGTESPDTRRTLSELKGHFATLPWS